MMQLAALNNLIERLQSDPASYRELVLATGLDIGTVRRYIKSWKRKKFIHVAEHRQVAVHNWTVCYQWGSEPDVVRVKTPRHEQMAAWYRSKKIPKTYKSLELTWVQMKIKLDTQ